MAKQIRIKIFFCKKKRKEKEKQKVIRGKWLWMAEAFYIHTQGICFSFLKTCCLKEKWNTEAKKEVYFCVCLMCRRVHGSDFSSQH
jgi:hypothetical protein